MFDLFAPAPPDYRRQRLQEYEQFLLERDGELDMKAWTLSKREAQMRAYETVPARPRAADISEFEKHYARFDKRNPPSKEMMLLLALVKVNAAEAYGVTRTVQRARARAAKDGDMSELRLLCEEGYHTRILLSASNLYGIEVNQPYTPPSALRVMIGGMAHMPASLARPLGCAGEIIGTVLFVKLLDVAREVLKDAPEIRDAVEERLLEIAIDERGHISYNRMTMGPAALAETRLILPAMTRVLSTVLPEVVALGAFPGNIWEELPRITDPRRLPRAVREQSFVA